MEIDNYPLNFCAHTTHTTRPRPDRIAVPALVDAAHRLHCRQVRCLSTSLCVACLRARIGRSIGTVSFEIVR